MLSFTKRCMKDAFDLSASVLGPQRSKSKHPRLWILMYHRVLPEIDRRHHLEEPGMIVTPKTLEMHILEAKKLFTMVSLNDWVKRYKTKQDLPQRACALTFDDGWADNQEYAMPILTKHQVPATLFAVVDKLGSNFRFWPNIIAELMNANYQGLGDHLLFTKAASAAKQAFSKETLAEVIADLKQHSEDVIFNALDAINWQQGLTDCDKALMSWEQLANSTFEVGCHTNTHRRLTSWLEEDALDYEIKQSQRRLKQQLGRAQSLFCYPNGDYSESALAFVRETYHAAVTTQRGINMANNLDLHQLKRIPLHNDIANTPRRFRARLSAWQIF